MIGQLTDTLGQNRPLSLTIDWSILIDCPSQVIRKEFIISKYSHKTFCSLEGIEKFLPDIKLGILWKKRLKGPGWRPCFTKLDRLRGTLEYYTHKSIKQFPKASINLGQIEVFIERMTREVGLNMEDGEFYLHLACEQNTNINRTRIFLIKKKNSVANIRFAEPEIPQIRNLYFRPTTDLELYSWYVSIMSVKHACVLKQQPNATRDNCTIKQPFTFDRSLTGTETKLYTLMEPTARKSVFGPPSKNDLYPLDIPPHCTNIDPMISLPDAPAPSPIHRDTFNSGNMELNLFSSEFQDCAGESLQLDCSDLIGQDNELDISVRTVPLDSELSEQFDSCPPGTETNPFCSGSRVPPPPAPVHGLDNGTNSPATANLNLFQLDHCPIYSDYETVHFTPPDNEEKTSWICTPVEVPQRNLTTLPTCPLDTPIPPLCPTPIDYATIRADTSRARKYHVMSGWLEKVGEHKNDIWRRRWFTLFNTHVTYSETPLSPSPKGHFYLGPDTKGYSVDTLKSKNHLLSPPNGFIFRVVTPGRLYHLCAKSDAMSRDWINVLSNVIAFANVLI